MAIGQKGYACDGVISEQSIGFEDAREFILHDTKPQYLLHHCMILSIDLNRPYVFLRIPNSFQHLVAVCPSPWPQMRSTLELL